jgi:hypothetical protein
MTIDEWTEGLALRQLTEPVNAGAVRREGLRQAKCRHHKAEDGDRAHQRFQTARGVDKHRRHDEIDQQGADLEDH